MAKKALGAALNLKEDFNPKSIAFECLRILSGHNVPVSSGANARDVHRVALRLGLTSTDNSTKVEDVLQSLLPSPEWAELRAHLAKLAETVCHARDPKCGSCPLRALCREAA